MEVQLPDRSNACLPFYKLKLEMEPLESKGIHYLGVWARLSELVLRCSGFDCLSEEGKEVTRIHKNQSHIASLHANVEPSHVSRREMIRSTLQQTELAD